MGNAFITRRAAKQKKITFTNKLMILTKTLQNVLSVPRYNAAIASDFGYISAVGGVNTNGVTVSDIDFFNRSGKHWHAQWPDELANMTAIICDHRLIGAGGRYTDGTLSKSVKRWALKYALQNEGTPVAMSDLRTAREGMAAARYRGIFTMTGGLQSDGIATNGAYIWNQLNKRGGNGSGLLAELLARRSFHAICNVSERGILLAGGINNNTLTNSVESIGLGVDNDVNVSSKPALSAAQYKPVAAEIYAEDGTHCALVGLGQTLSQTIVPYIDIYYTNSTEDLQIVNEKLGTITLQWDGQPTSAVGFSFGDCALFIIGYNDGTTKNKGYLVQLKPLRVTTMEFNFSRSYLQGGVVGHDVAYLLCGNKNGSASRDVEMIQLLRNVPIYPGMKYKLGSMASEATSNILTLHPLETEFNLSGYMKL